MNSLKGFSVSKKQYDVIHKLVSEAYELRL